MKFTVWKGDIMFINKGATTRVRPYKSEIGNIGCRGRACPCPINFINLNSDLPLPKFAIKKETTSSMGQPQGLHPTILLPFL